MIVMSAASLADLSTGAAPPLWCPASPGGAADVPGAALEGSAPAMVGAGLLAGSDVEEVVVLQALRDENEDPAPCASASHA